MGQKGFMVAGLAAVAQLALLHAALADPPRQSVGAALAHGAKVGAERDVPRLDLRAPSLVLPAEQTTEISASLSSRRGSIWDPPFRSEQVETAQSGHINSPLQTVVHNFRQEGLPIAKLFQSNTSLVHLGFNPKGKPGLWLIHKLH